MMEAPLTSLYQALILEHYRNPRNKGELADHTVEAHVANPVCGDEVKVQIRLDGDRIEEIAFGGPGMFDLAGVRVDDDRPGERDGAERCDSPCRPLYRYDARQ